MVSMLAWSLIDYWSGQTKGYKIGIFCYNLIKHNFKLWGVRAKTGWLKIRIMSLSGTTCLSFHGLMFQWANIIKIKLSVDCNLFKIVMQHVCFVKGRGICSSGERSVKILLDFRKSPRFSLVSPSSQLREKSSRCCTVDLKSNWTSRNATCSGWLF
jgi:hypothetical protein